MDHLNRFYFDESRSNAFREALESSFSEMVILQTCNRFECYLASHNLDVDFLQSTVMRLLGISRNEYESVFYFKTGPSAIRHLLEVSASLDSVVLGESQILSQIKRSWSESQARGYVKKHLNRLFSVAVKAGKRVRSETTICRGAVSVSQAAVELSRNFFADLSEVNAAVVGAGEMGALALRHLMAAGVKHPIILNRTRARAESLASTLHCRSAALSELDSVLSDIDVLFCAVEVQSPLITVARLNELLAQRRYKTLFLIDISLPLSIEPEVTDLPGVFSYDIEDLKQVVDQNRDERLAQREAVEKILNEEFIDFQTWQQQQTLIPGLQSLTRLRGAEVKLLAGRLENEASLDSDRALDLLGARMGHVLMRLLKETGMSEECQRRAVKILGEEASRSESKLN